MSEHAFWELSCLANAHADSWSGWLHPDSMLQHMSRGMLLMHQTHCLPVTGKVSTQKFCDMTFCLKQSHMYHFPPIPSSCFLAMRDCEAEGTSKETHCLQGRAATMKKIPDITEQALRIRDTKRESRATDERVAAMDSQRAQLADEVASAHDRSAAIFTQSQVMQCCHPQVTLAA